MTGLDVHMAGDDIVVTDPASDFVAIYHKPTREPWLKLKQRTLTKDYVLYASAFKAANDKARELGGLYRGLRGFHLAGGSGETGHEVFYANNSALAEALT